ncbi:class I SAM-dependent methyltransferase [Devosia geojensis]|uniref:class I SAM-dependent methyltransferase n=1 Tax=Devosia geojensis TaxID=443610 RepID=UPI000A063C24|nr:class I SAM-dependent methyltransferase [Devosia geojensis]
MDAETAWDAEYAAGRYKAEAPVAFVEDILAYASAADLVRAEGLYIGCGNGRNYLPLVSNGLNLTGLDISQVALTQLAERFPAGKHRLIHGDLSALPAGRTYALVIGIQVFQHGNQAVAHAHIRTALERVALGGLFCMRVNAAGTDLPFAHEVTEHSPGGGFTALYLDGPKRGLEVHFFGASEIADLLHPWFDPILPLRVQQTWRKPPGQGQWSQWEGIWRRVR